MNKYLILDNEMGGRDLRYSLLQSAFIVVDNSFNEVARLTLNVKPDDGDYILSGQGMSVNKIDIAQHDTNALPYKSVKSTLYSFLSEHTNNAQFKLIPIGHGVSGDIDFVIKSLISEGSWYKFCRYQFIDTSVVLQFLRDCGKMPLDCDGSVAKLAEYFNIFVIGQLHDAMVDAELTWKIYKKMVNLINNN
jgi:hypothetical protein